MSNQICDYGCGKEAQYKFKNGKLCCSRNVSQCLSIKEKSNYKRTPEIIEKMSVSRKEIQEFLKCKFIRINFQEKRKYYEKE